MDVLKFVDRHTGGAIFTAALFFGVVCGIIAGWYKDGPRAGLVWAGIGFAMTLGLICVFLPQLATIRAKLFGGVVKKIPGDESAEVFYRLTPLWADGKELFGEEWVLTLSITTPPNIQQLPTSLYQLYELFAGLAMETKAALLYFAPGKYRIAKDGSMHKLTDEEVSLLSGYPQIEASMDVRDIPYDKTIENIFRDWGPSNPLEEGKNCVILDAHAHGKYKKGSESESDIMIRFGAREGRVIIVESWT